MVWESSVTLLRPYKAHASQQVREEGYLYCDPGNLES